MSKSENFQNSRFFSQSHDFLDSKSLFLPTQGLAGLKFVQFSIIVSYKRKMGPGAVMDKYDSVITTFGELIQFFVPVLGIK